MKYFAVTIILVIESSVLLANNHNKELEQILFQSYDSIRNEMIITACKIGGITDSTLLKEISEGRVDSARASCKRDSTVLELARISNVRLTNVGINNSKYDSLVRIIRANLMGHLLVNNYEYEDRVFREYKKYKLSIDSLSSEVKDYLSAEGDNALKRFVEKYPNSKFCKLINLKDDGEGDGMTNYILVILVAIIVICLILVFLYYSRKSNDWKKQDVINQQIKNPSLRQTVISETDNDNIRGPIISSSSLTTSGVSQIEMSLQSHEDEKLKTGMLDDNLDIDSINAFAEQIDNWTVVGASVIGNSHVSMGLPCQDNNKYVYLNDGWGIAIVSDGAGSAKHSEVGSRIVVERGAYYFQRVIEQKGWIDKKTMPTEAEWTSLSYNALKAVRDDLEKFSVAKNLDFKSLSATIIVVIHSPHGFLVTHIGDGRAGYRDDTGDWKALITPHKGEEANQTIFVTSEFWNLPYYVMSGVMVPESHVVRCTPRAFTLMSDGCEHAAWQCYAKDEKTGMYYDPNKPHGRFFDPLVTNIMNNANRDLKNQWAAFLMNGNDSFKKEPDDKTMILCVF